MEHTLCHMQISMAIPQFYSKSTCSTEKGLLCPLFLYVFIGLPNRFINLNQPEFHLHDIGPNNIANIFENGRFGGST